MVTTLGQLKTRILYETNKTSQDFEQGVQNAIVSAIIYMESEHPWLFTKTSTVTVGANTNATSLPDDLNQLISATFNLDGANYTERTGFVWVPYDELITYFGNTGDTGIPLKYSNFQELFYIYPITASDQDFTLIYHYKDEFYPNNDSDISIWFNDQTIDLVRTKALEIFYRDTLQSSEIADTYVPVYQDYVRNLQIKNNKRNVFNRLSI